MKENIKEKWIWAICSLACGLTLCIYKNKALSAVGVIAGVALIAVGIFFVAKYLKTCNYLPLAIAFIVSGILLIALCLIFEGLAFFLGGLIFLFGGAALFLYCKLCCGHLAVLQMIFCLLCVLSGIIMVISPASISFFSFVAGIWLVIYSFAFVLLWN